MAKQAKKSGPPERFTLKIAQAAGDGGITVDAEKGIIGNVSFITKGPALGHDFDIDDTALDQVFDSLSHKTKGVKSRLSHPWAEDGLMVRVGRGVATERAADKVRGYVQLGDYAATTPYGDLRTYLLKLAAEDPSSFGISIVFEASGFEERTDEQGRSLAPAVRVRDVLAADFVDDPAANPDGLMSRGADPGQGQEPNGAGEVPARGDSLMNEKLRKFLETECGLKADATDAQALEFLSKLSGDQKDKALAMLAQPDEPAPKPEPKASPPAADPPAPAGLTAEQEQERILGIQGLAKKYGLKDEWSVEQIKGKKSFDEARVAALEAFASTHQPIKVGADRNIESLGTAVSDAICLRAGIPLFDLPEALAAAKRVGRGSGKFDLKTRPAHERARDFESLSLVEMGREALRQLGVAGVNQMPRPRIATLMCNLRERMSLLGPNVALAHSTSDFDYILADALNKNLLAAYALAPRTWTAWVRRRSNPDFKSIKLIRMSEAPDLAVIPEGGELTYGKIADTQETVTLAKYGRALVLTKEAIINDDLDAFARLPVIQGNAAARLEDDTVYAILTANAAMAEDSVALFHTATHKNLATGAGAPSVTTLNTAFAAMAKQTAFAPTGETGPVLNITPRFILAPVVLRGTVMQLLNSTADPAGTNAGVANIWQNGLTPVFDARLDANSSTAWYLAADANAGIDTVVIVFLEGEEVPQFEEQSDFGTGDKHYAVRHTVAAKAVDWRGLYKHAGA